MLTAVMYFLYLVTMVSWGMLFVQYIGSRRNADGRLLLLAIGLLSFSVFLTAAFKGFGAI